MAYARRRYRRRPIRRGRRGRFRKNRIYHPMRRASNNMHTYRQQFDLTAQTVTAGITYTSGFAFTIGDITQATTFSNLYDQYRLLGVKLVFYPQFTSYNAGTSTTAQAVAVPEIYTVIDFDSSTPIGIPQLSQYKTLRRQFFNRPHTRYFRPLPMVAVTNATGVTAGSANISNKIWMDFADTGIPYYGLLVAISTVNPAQNPAQTIRICATYYFQCKSVK